MPICVVCESSFAGKKNAKTCSPACRQRKYRKVGVQPAFAELKKRAGNKRITCVPHAIATAAQEDVHDVYEKLCKMESFLGRARKGTGWHHSVYGKVLYDYGFEETIVPAGTLLDDKRFKTGRWVIVISRHAFAFIDGVVHDLWDSRRKYLKRVRRAYLKVKTVK